MSASAPVSCTIFLCSKDKEKGLPFLGGLRYTYWRDYRWLLPTTTAMARMDVTPLSKHRSRAGTRGLCRSHGALLSTLYEAGEFLQHASGVPRGKGLEECGSRGGFLLTHEQVDAVGRDVDANLIPIGHEPDRPAVQGRWGDVANAESVSATAEPAVGDERTVVAAKSSKEPPRDVDPSKARSVTRGDRRTYAIARRARPPRAPPAGRRPDRERGFP